MCDYKFSMHNFDRQKQGKRKQIIMGEKTRLEYAAAGCQEYTPHMAAHVCSYETEVEEL